MAPTEPVPENATVATRVATLGYHEVTDDPRSTGFQRPGAVPFTLTSQSFALQLERIATGWRNPTLVTEVDFGSPGDHLLLTFDDGGKSALYAADQLARCGWRGHFFIVTGLVGGRTFVGWDDIRYLRACGHMIGSHSHTHPDLFRELPAARMSQEWRRSADLIADRLGEPCIAASVPGGDISRAVLRSGAEAGFRFLFTVDPMVQPFRVADCLVLGRFLVKRSHRPEQVKDLIDFRGWRRALAFRRLKRLARVAFPPLYRQLVRSRTRSREDLTA